MTFKWADRYLRIAKEVSTWSKDDSTKVGAVIIGNKGQIVSQGYNGFPRGVDDDVKSYADREFKYNHVVHAEANCIYNAIHNNTTVRDCTIYVTGLPVCHECAKIIIQCGIAEVIIDTLPKPNWTKSATISAKMLTDCGVKYKIIDLEKKEISDVDFSKWEETGG